LYPSAGALDTTPEYRFLGAAEERKVADVLKIPPHETIVCLLERPGLGIRIRAKAFCICSLITVAPPPVISAMP
jgi:hypothetical protein